MKNFATKNLAAVMTVALSFAAAACHSNNNSNSPVSQAASQSSGQSGADFPMPNVKYPAALMFEGGQVNFESATEAKTYTPTWRLYLCLENTDRPITEHVELDFDQMGFLAETPSYGFDASASYSTQRLKKVILHYSYTTQLSNNPAANYGYAYGKASVQLHSDQVWETINHSSNHRSGRPSSNYRDLDIFNADITYSDLAKYADYSHGTNGVQFYIAQQLDRFTFSQEDKRSHVIEVCERGGKPYVLQVGDQITR
jgi:hypothetical protein